MAITPKEKELAAGGNSVVTGCNSCPDYHIKVVRKAHASDKEIKQAVADALEVRKRDTEIMGAYAQAHLGEKATVNIRGRADEITRVKELVSMRGGVWRELCRDS
jgi:AhpD family alkylhydroperoxidase